MFRDLRITKSLFFPCLLYFFPDKHSIFIGLPTTVFLFLHWIFYQVLLYHGTYHGLFWRKMQIWLDWKYYNFITIIHFGNFQKHVHFPTLYIFGFHRCRFSKTIPYQFLNQSNHSLDGLNFLSRIFAIREFTTGH